jgi:hypothetical protein
MRLATRGWHAVAIKVASARFSERFQREARAISALNQPNICTLYDVGPNYLVMEYVEGKWQVSKDAGNWPRWPNDREIVFQGANPGPLKLSAAVSGKGAVFENETPRRLFRGPIATWDVTSDGERLLMAVPHVQRGAEAPITIVLNCPRC